MRFQPRKKIAQTRRRGGLRPMKEDPLGEFNIPSDVKKKLENKDWLKKQFAKGKTAQEVLRFSDDTMAKFYHAAQHLFEHKRYESAANAFLFLVTLNPHIHEYWLGLGMSSQMCGQMEGAIDAYEMAACYKLDSPIPYFYLAKCFHDLHDKANALHAFNLAIEHSGSQEEYAEIKKQAIRAKKILES